MLFTKAFWVTTLEVVAIAFGSAFAGSLVLTTTPTWHGFIAAAVAGGVAAIYAFTKQLGGAQAVQSGGKVGITPPTK